MTEPITQPPAPHTIRETVRPTPASWIPETPKMVDVAGIDDEASYRRFMARNSASQTLSLQRTEWYARSVRLYIQFWFWLTLIGAVVGIILMIVLVNSTGTSTPADPFNP